MREVTLLQMHAQHAQMRDGFLRIVIPGLRDVTHNERVTRKRVDTMDARLDALDLFTLMTCWERVRWLVTGRVPAAPPATESVYVPPDKGSAIGSDVVGEFPTEVTEPALVQ